MRLHGFSLLTAALLIAVITAAQPSMFRGSAEHRGEYRGAGVAAFGGLQWRVQTLGPVRGSPTVVGGSVYIGSSDGHLYALDLRSGDVRWRRNLQSPIMSTPAADNELIIVADRRRSSRR
ncbi:MAG: PQQ-binding-like beta-propeller repeat protein [Gemmatimonadaceae bacterium]